MDILCDSPLPGGTYRAALPSLWAGYCAAVFVPSNLDTGAVPGEGRKGNWWQLAFSGYVACIQSRFLPTG